MTATIAESFICSLAHHHLVSYTASQHVDIFERSHRYQPIDQVDWDKLGFKERDVNGLVRVTYKDGKWGALEISKDSHLNVHAAAPCLNYGQQAFEGIKAFRTSTGSVRVFRPQENWTRINLSARMASMPELPQDLFLEAIKVAVALNLEYVPPYKKNASGGALYIRPLCSLPDRCFCLAVQTSSPSWSG